MSKTIQPTFRTTRVVIPLEKVSPLPGGATWFNQINAYITRQSSGPNRFKWMGISMMLQSAIITPIVAVTILFSSNWPPLWFAATASMYSVFIPTLSGQSTKWVMRVFFINIAFSLLVMLTAILHSLIT